MASNEVFEAAVSDSRQNESDYEYYYSENAEAFANAGGDAEVIVN